MEELGAQAHLAPEALYPVVARAGGVAARGDDLQRHVLPGRQLARPVDAPEAPGAELAQKLVAALEERADLRPLLRRRHDRPVPTAHAV